MSNDAAASRDISRDSPELIEVELRDPRLAAFLAWLLPGAGHFYQRRVAKGVLFMTCILGTYFFGMYLGEGRVVYASLRSEDRRLPYFCQVGVGLPALPAVVQARREKPLFGGLMAPPRLPQGRGDPGELAEWHERMHAYFELGTVYTMIAGLLNILAIYDAWGGPLLMIPSGAEKEGHEKRPDDHPGEDAPT